MNSPIIPKIVCQRCRASLDADDNYCRRCGAPTANVAGVSGGGWAATDSSAERPSWWDRPWFIVLMLFLVLGPLALPLLWRSRQFSLQWKITLTVLVTVLTGWLCWRLWLALQQTAAMLDQIQKQL
jgi:hypothetical protein